MTAAHRSPSWTEVTLGAALSAVLGVTLGAVYLVLQPVETLKAPPNEGETRPGAVYFLPGSHDAAKSREAAAKQQAFLTGGSVVLNEDEINAIIAPAAKPTAQPAPGAAAAGGETVSAGAPNFRIRDGVLQIGVPLTFDVASVSRTVIVQVRGAGFVKRGGAFTLSPAEFYLGACPLHRLPLASELLFRRLVAAAPIPGEVAIAWGNLADVAVDGATLRLTVP